MVWTNHSARKNCRYCSRDRSDVVKLYSLLNAITARGQLQEHSLNLFFRYFYYSIKVKLETARKSLKAFQNLIRLWLVFQPCTKVVNKWKFLTPDLNPQLSRIWPFETTPFRVWERFRKNVTNSKMGDRDEQLHWSLVWWHAELAVLQSISNALFKRRAIATNTAFETFLSSAWEGNRW